MMDGGLWQITGASLVSSKQRAAQHRLGSHGVAGCVNGVGFFVVNALGRFRKQFESCQAFARHGNLVLFAIGENVKRVPAVITGAVQPAEELYPLQRMH